MPRFKSSEAEGASQLTSPRQFGLDRRMPLADEKLPHAAI